MRRRLPLLVLALLLTDCNCGPGVSSATAHLEVDPRVLDFGDVPVGGNATRSVRLANTGRAQLTLTGTSFTGDQRGTFSVGLFPARLEAGESYELQVFYRAPATPGADAASLAIALDGADSDEEQVALLGRSVPQLPADAGGDAGAGDGGAGDAGGDAGAGDAGADAGDDAGIDAGTDAGTDAGLDAGTDAGLDAGTSADGGVDGGGTGCADGGTGCQPRMVHAYDGFSCALVEDGRLFCWGLVPDSCCTPPYWRYQDVTEVPLPVFSGTGVLSLEGGAGTMCVRQDQGPVACSGRQVRPNFTLSLVSGLGSGVARVSGSSSYLCALRLDAGVECWGAGVIVNDGAGPNAVPFPDVTAPTPVAGFGPATEVAVGFTHICDRDRSSLKCWGYNSSGSGCPMGASQGIRLPGIVQPVSRFDAGVVAMVSHDRGTCVVDGAGDVWCWGDNLGPYGTGQTYRSCSAVQLTGFGGPVTALCSGGQHACALEASGSVRCWGENYGKGLLGYVLDSGVYDDGRNTPTLIPGITNAVQVSCGSVHSCALTADKRVLCWGDNHAFGVTWGGLGYADAGLPFSPTPIQVPLPR